MRKLTSFIITCIIGLSIVCYVGYRTKQACVGAAFAEKEYILSPMEFQELLNRLEPNDPIVVDGKIGRKTIAKWESVYNNQMAIKIDGGFYGKD